MRDFNSSLKLAGGGEGDRCKYPYRLDTYGCGCQHDCSYCYAKSLLYFRKMWDAEKPRVGDMSAIGKEINKLPKGQVVRLGGMTDCLMPMELTHRNTYKAIKKLNARNQPYLIVTKSAIAALPEYMDVYDPKLAHFQISITATDNSVSAKYEKASSVEKRLEAYERLSKAGFDTALRVSPYIPGNIDWRLLEGHKLQLEFLRVNSWIKKWMPLDYRMWTLKEGGYEHLPLASKVAVIDQVKAIGNFDEISVCEDVQAHYDYWVRNVNANPEDCCNLRKENNGSTGA